MKGDLPKVLYEICGRPMLGFVVSACRLAGVDRLIAVVGHGKDRVIEAFAAERDITWIEQTEQKGTGHAVLCCREALRGFSGSLLVVAGDMPLVRRTTLIDLLDARERSGDAVTIATTELNDPTGYGRIVRGDDGRLVAIVEDRDCSAEQLLIREVNPSYYCFDADRLFDALERLEPEPAKGEYYLTDAIRMLREDGCGVSATVRVPPEEASGVNSRLDLAAVGRMMQDRIQRTLVSDGVTIVDPDNTWIEADASVGSETTVYPFTFIGTGAVVGDACRLGPFACIGPGESLAAGSIVGSVGGPVVKSVVDNGVRGG